MIFETRAKKKIFGLIILDGWGIAPVWGGNAVSLAEVKNFNSITRNYPFTTLRASDGAVGLPELAPGNSEAGHLNIGAGRKVNQEQPIIDAQIESGAFFQNKVMIAAIDHAKKNNSALHLMGLMSKTGTHSQITHVYAILKLCQQQNFSNVLLHLFTDGRDSDSMSGIETLAEVEKQLQSIGVGRISTVVGRFYAMDRDNRWDRIRHAYDLLTTGKGNQFGLAGEIFTKSYARGVTDEFIEPSVITSKTPAPGLISDNDAVIFFNYRADRTRELALALQSGQPVKELPNRKILNNLYFATFVMHGDTNLGQHVFERQVVDKPLAEIISGAGLRQYHSAETEKYAHVTYFFNGGREKAYPGEDWQMIPSPRSVPTYDLMPEMSAQKLTESLVSVIEQNKYDFFVVNFANPDMVGHTGNLKAAVKAVEFVDKCLGVLLNSVLKNNGTVFVFADHGNVEQMVNPRTGEPDTEHTTNSVPFTVVSSDPNLSKDKLHLRPDGALANIAPTMLDLMNVPYDHAILSESLIVKQVSPEVAAEVVQK